MKRGGSLVGLLLIAFVAPLGSQFRHPDCVTDKRCPSGVQPPKCCEPPPCQFFAELGDLRAREHFFTRETADLALRVNGGDINQALQAMLDTQNLGPAPDWCERNVTIRPRLMSVDTSKGCAIVAPGGDPVTREDAHRDSNSCPEYVDAEFDRMELRRDYCLAGPNRNIYDEVDQYRHEYQVQARRLQAELQEHWRACSNASPNPWLRREMENAGVDMSPGGVYSAIGALISTSGSRR